MAAHRPVLERAVEREVATADLQARRVARHERQRDAAIGLVAARLAIAELSGRSLAPPPPETALGALLGHITGGADAASYQPMNVNFGLFPPVAEDVRKKDRKLAYTQRASAALAEWMKVAEGVAA